MQTLLDYAKTKTQKDIIKAYIEEGTHRKAAKKLGYKSKSFVTETISRVKRYAALSGYSPEHDMDKPAPEPYTVKGVSTLYDEEGNKKIQWVKTQVDKEAYLKQLVESLKDSFEKYDGKFKATSAKKQTDKDLLVVYPMGDPHIGMYSYAAETGDDFDVTIASKNLKKAVSNLVERSPNADTAIILNLGDYFHTDNSDNKTARSGNTLDVDTRWSRVLAIGIDVMIQCVESALNKHKKVVVKNIIGNHDDHSSMFLSIALDKFFSKEPRVEVDTLPSKFWYYKFGKILIGSTHGDMAKPINLPSIMAADKSKEWGETEFRYWYTGHIHNKQAMEFPGVVWESFRTLAAKDAWHSGMGYRSGRDMVSIIHHKNYGEVGRNIASIAMIQDLGS